MGVVGAVDEEAAYGGGELLAAYSAGGGEGVGGEGADAGGGELEGLVEFGAGVWLWVVGGGGS